MLDFEELVVNCRKKNTDRDIHNSSWNHALILFKNLFLSAQKNKKNVSIVSGTLNTDFYSELVDYAKDTMKTQKVELIVLDPDQDISDNAFANAINENKANGVLIQGKGKSITSPHFIVVGDDKYRFEIDHEQTRAIANFKNKIMGKQLTNLFSSLKNQIHHPLPLTSE